MPAPVLHADILPCGLMPDAKRGQGLVGLCQTLTYLACSQLSRGEFVNERCCWSRTSMDLDQQSQTCVQWKAKVLHMLGRLLWPLAGVDQSTKVQFQDGMIIGKIRWFNGCSKRVCYSAAISVWATECQTLTWFANVSQTQPVYMPAHHSRMRSWVCTIAGFTLCRPTQQHTACWRQ